MKIDVNGHCGEDMHIAIGERRVLMSGMTVRGNGNTFVAVDLGMEADPKTFTNEVIASEEAALPGWRFKKEYLRDWDAQNGSPVFDEQWIDRQRGYATNPVMLMDIHKITKNGIAQRNSLGHYKYMLVEKKTGRLKVFVPPNVEDDPDLAGLTNLPEMRQRTYGAGMDVGEGVEKSDSTISVMAADTREIVATFACNTIRPGLLGRFAVEVGKHYNNALICCVRKMHGMTALRAIADVGYPMIWRATNPKRGLREVKIKDLGWPRGEITSDLLVGPWVDALEQGIPIIRCLETTEQHRQYIYDERGKPCHQRLKSYTPEVREKHGDLVISAALAYRACIDLPKYRVLEKPQTPEGSAAARRKIRENLKQKKARDGW